MNNGVKCEEIERKTHREKGLGYSAKEILDDR